MAAPIGPGDWVEFLGRPAGYVNPAGGPGMGSLFVLGAVYRVTEVGRLCGDGDGKAWPSLRTANLPLPYSVPVAAFRPIYRPKADLIESLKAPPVKAPKRVRETA